MNEDSDFGQRRDEPLETWIAWIALAVAFFAGLGVGYWLHG